MLRAEHNDSASVDVRACHWAHVPSRGAICRFGGRERAMSSRVERGTAAL